MEPKMIKTPKAENSIVASIDSKAVDTEQVVLNPHELADAYALKTLYAHLVANGVDASFAKYDFGLNNFGCLIGLPKRDAGDGLVVGTLSAISVMHKGISIDISVLKNSVMPMDREQKDELKRQYG